MINAYTVMKLGKVSQVTFGSGRMCRELNRPGQPDGFEEPPRRKN